MKKRVVYSTDSGRHCPACSKPVALCVCPAKKEAQAISSVRSDGSVLLHRQSKGRKGKPVTLISGLDLDMAARRTLCSQLKSKCGVGGSVTPEGILIQGDQRTMLSRELQNRGFNVKVQGG
jgi:translation initiation factor 1